MPLAERERKVLWLARDSRLCRSREINQHAEEAALLAHTGPYGAVGLANPSPYPLP